MNLREKIENNLVIWLLGALFSGFGAGIATYKAVLDMAQLEVISRAKLEALQAAQAQGKESGREGPATSTGRTSEGRQPGQVENPGRPTDSQSANSLPGKPSGASEKGVLFQRLPVFEVKASSFRRSSLDFPPQNVANGVIQPQYNRSWQSGSGDLEGAWIELHLPEQHTVNRIRVYMLVAESLRGGQIRDAKVSFSDGSEQEMRFPFEHGWQSIDLKEVKTDVVRIEASSVYPGDNGINNLEVAEVELYGK